MSNKNFNINNFIISHVIRGVMLNNSDNSIMWAINQIEDPTLNISSETQNSVDALGSVLASFSRAKKAEFSANQCIFDLSLLAAQLGTEKQVASEDKIIVIPTFETLIIPFNYINLTDTDGNILVDSNGIALTDGTESSTTLVKLKNTPIDIPKIIYKLNNDDSLGQHMNYSAELTKGSFIYSDGYLRFLREDVGHNDKFFITYNYKSNSAVSVINNSIDVPKVGKFILEVLGCDICNPNLLIYAYLIFPNAVLDANVDLDFTTEGRHPFTILARQNMCDPEKVLFRLIIPDDAK